MFFLRFLLLGVAVTIASASSAWSQFASVGGTIRDQESGVPVGYAGVRIRGLDAFGPPYESGVLSSDSGLYLFPEVPSGQYVVAFSHVAYEDRVDTLVVTVPDTMTLDITLVPGVIVMGELVVQTSRLEKEREAQPAVISLDAETLEQIPSVGEPDPIRQIQLLPGVAAASDISSGLYIRGGGPDQTLVLLDDVTIFNPTHAFGFFSTFNSDMIDRVTLYKGAYPAAHGGRLGAVLAVNTHDLPVSKVRGSGGISTIASRITLEGPAGKHQWLVSGRRTYLDPLLSLLRRNDPTIPSYYFYDLNGKFTFRHGSSYTTIMGYTGRDDIRFDLDASTFIDFRWGNTLGQVAHTRVYSREFSTTVAGSASRYESTSELKILNTPFSFQNGLTELALRATADWHPVNRLQLLSGAVVSFYDFRYQQFFNQVNSIDYRATPWEVALYGDGQWTWGAATALRAGLRLRYISDGQRVLVEPRFSMGQPVGNFRFKVAGGVYHQYLQLISSEGFSAGDFYVPIDETLDPGRSYQAVTGAEWNVSPMYRLGLEWYYTRLDNLVLLNNTVPVDQTSTASVDIFKSGGKGHASGVELFAEKRMGPITGWIGYTLGTTRRQFADVNGGEEFPPKYDRRHDINVVANYNRGKWEYGLAFLYATGQAFTPASARYRIRDPATGEYPNDNGSQVLPATKNSARLLPYHRLDVSVARSFGLWGADSQWFVQISNLYNRRNEWFVQYDSEQIEADVINQLPIIPSLGIRFKF